jgi:hypothetical protein
MSVFQVPPKDAITVEEKQLLVNDIATAVVAAIAQANAIVEPVVEPTPEPVVEEPVVTEE